MKRKTHGSEGLRRLWALGLSLILVLAMSACGNTGGSQSSAASSSAADKNGEVMIFYTTDVHCGINEGFGYVGLAQIRDTYEARGYEVLLVDNGDALQGEAVGLMSQGEAIINLMKDLKYDVATPGNHDFDYGMDVFTKLTKKASFPYVSCNLRKEGQLCLKPYVIKEVAGMKIAFVGITTPETLISSTPKIFQDENGKFIYDFSGEGDGSLLYKDVQDAVDAARAEGADLVYALGHVGKAVQDIPWTYADIISHTEGIDVFIDGHSHDTDQIKIKNKAGKEVLRSAAGTKLNSIGYSNITKDKKIKETGLLTWSNDKSVAELFGIKNETTSKVEATMADINKKLQEVVGHTDVELTIMDPDAKDSKGNPLRAVRKAETNLGDMCTDALRVLADTDISIVNGGGIRANIAKGDITYNDIINVFPFGNQVCVVEATGQEILDALEWSAAFLPDENGGFLHVSGMKYEIDSSVPTPCKSDENGMLQSISGKRRVSNVTIGDKALDPNAKYTVAGLSYILKEKGNGYTCFEKSAMLKDNVMIDNEALITFIKENLKGNVGEEYSNPTGVGRITIK
ncbi:MAG: bifunctional metallophosphatase/5'-nucleotidase [Lachnospiraceae bacterium]|nr:bifunctional metallophosphatase/5'-nucleotidase [Lachnospiraceae bacterium]